MMFQIGDLVRIQRGFTQPSEKEFDWIGMLVGYIPESLERMGEAEWLVQWSHEREPAYEYGYYLEVI